MKPTTLEEKEAIINMHKANLAKNNEAVKNLKQEKEKLKALLNTQKVNGEAKEKIKDTKYYVRHINIQLFKKIFSAKYNARKVKKALR